MKNNIWSFIISEQERNKNVILILTADTKGSSAGKIGFKCAVSDSGKVAGTVGGGTAEYLMIEKAKKMFANSKFNSELKELVHNPDAIGEQSGMICSGRQTFILIKIHPSEIETIKKIKTSEEKKSKSGIFCVKDIGIKFMENEIQEREIVFTKKSETQFEYNELIGKNDTLYIVGGGHVGAAVSNLLCSLDFCIKVFDNRKELKIFNDIESADKKNIIDYNNFSEHLQNNDNKYILIMTANHTSDQIILEASVNSDAKYIGMLGSKSKRNTIYKNLEEKGINKEKLEQVFCPIGVPIISNTPKEIAISIAAELIDFRNRKRL